MGLSVSLLIAASFAILCTYYIGDKILVIDFSAYRPQNLKKAKLEINNKNIKADDPFIKELLDSLKIVMA